VVGMAVAGCINGYTLTGRTRLRYCGTFGQ
jgi:hypothetical protein